MTLSPNNLPATNRRAPLRSVLGRSLDFPFGFANLEGARPTMRASQWICTFGTVKTALDAGRKGCFRAGPRWPGPSEPAGRGDFIHHYEHRT